MGAGLFRARRASATQPQPAPSPPPHPHEKRQEPQFLTRRIDYFRPRRPSHTNKRKSETPDNEAHPCDSPPHGSPKTPFSPLYGKIQGHFSVEKCPWIEISMGWIGRSMGWKSKSTGWIDERPPSRRISNAKRRTETHVRINSLPYSAQGSGAYSQAFAGASSREGGSLRRGGFPAARKRSGHPAPPRHTFPVVGRSEGVGRRVAFSHGSNVHAAGLTAPWGPNYSITTGKRSAPAVRTPPTSSAPRGSNAREACQARRHSIG